MIETEETLEKKLFDLVKEHGLMTVWVTIRRLYNHRICGDCGLIKEND